MQSVLRQTHAASEIIVVDDGSTDNTATMLQERYPQVLLIRTDNKGVSHARNCGLQAARCNWIALLDSDDEWVPNKLESQLAALDSNPDFRICHCNEKWIRNGKRLNQKKKHTKRGGNIFKYCLPLCVISPSAVIIDSSIFEDIGYFNEGLPACEDYDLWLRITAKYPVLYVDEPLVVKYGGHSDQLSQKHWGMDRFRIQALENIVHGGQLNAVDRNAALAMLVEKLEILIQGAKKRGNQEIVNCYHLKLHHYRRQQTDRECTSI